MKLLHQDLTEKIIKAYYKVYNNLGYGFLEKVYENALIIELTNMGLELDQQQPIEVFYEDRKVGTYYADVLINGKIILELKAATNIAKEHEAQLLNYLKATNIELGLLLNFGTEPKFKRIILQNKNKRA